MEEFSHEEEQHRQEPLADLSELAKHLESMERELSVEEYGDVDIGSEEQRLSTKDTILNMRGLLDQALIHPKVDLHTALRLRRKLYEHRLGFRVQEDGSLLDILHGEPAVRIRFINTYSKGLHGPS